MMARYKVRLTPSGFSAQEIELEADGYGTNSTSGELFLWRGEGNDKKNIATFAEDHWAGCWLLPEETKADV